MRVNNPSILTALLGYMVYMSVALAAGPQPFSQYGVIQGVTNYSTNPVYNPNSPYNMRMPTPVYAMGPQVDTQQCQTIVYNLIISKCALLNNCASTTLSEIRPDIMLSLSRMPGGNYAASCSGYLDSAFADYRTANTTSGPVGVTAFPDATAPNVNAYDSELEFYNPFDAKKPDWAIEMQERKMELENLQSQNGANNVGLERASFPTTYADLSFAERIANEAKGYEPYKDNRAFTEIEIESEEEYKTRHQNIIKMHDQIGMTTEEFCKKYPNEEICKNLATDTANREEIIQKIAQALRAAQK